MRLQRLAAAAAATALAASLVGCSDDTDTTSPADASSSTAPSAGTDASAVASAPAGTTGPKAKKPKKPKKATFPDATAKLSAEDQQKVRSLDRVGLGAKGQLVGDHDAVTVALYYAARQAMAADTGMDRTVLEAVSAGTALREATVYVSEHMDEKIPFSVDVVSSSSGTLEACVGPEAGDPRTLTVQDGKVVTDVAGHHAC